ncbi:beta-arrestin-1-like isoform X1 [Mya arenaria]|uniref:beta-arrestin-1-like isoform X1 n=1 Tax=Mya arenaria TaxID=6604 RepID=UPI0022DF06E1|nr:beta-arrestin-1-like isoform X1 [Mya arenaria]XP_052782757.1 beta-arrestin-1-like isoform X1 [Mya arenaria]XP_052782758.1 beta-arrestin-1-like isoform X1 [Mya arenaria]XP_052782759.1 beta-arrestin-1-like isoform X1 [Mya arenaria]XP_052782761.1 beta-arrestin-1-like isoform X1 [Mya arenaria]XP_052782762.1 beta-arrestin-1-like isoform X1 [Mya arenaria]
MPQKWKLTRGDPAGTWTSVNAVRVFKKSSPNGKVTVYLGKRDFIDHLTHIDPIDGVVLVDPEYLKERKVYAHVLAAFRYGREDLDVLGLTFRKDLFLASLQVYPPVKEQQKPPTRLQERLIKKLGPNAYPFFFELPPNAPASVTLQPAPGDTGKPCGVDYELKTYVAENLDEKPHKRNSIRLAIRKLTYAPEEPAPQPCAETSKDFMMSPGNIKLEATLDKEKYYHGESIAINVLVDNNTSKTVKKVKLSVRQFADICLFSTAQYKCTVAELESEEGFPIQPSQTGFCKVFHLTPLLSNNRDKRGLALDGKLKHEDTNLASSTIVQDNVQKENLGIVVSYKVKVRLILGFGSGDLSVELPFTLTHPKPQESPPPSRSLSISKPSGEGSDQPVDTNLIQLDTNEEGYEYRDDDFIFEDFARLRLKGHDGDDTEA